MNKDLKEDMKNYYGLTPDDLPVIRLLRRSPKVIRCLLLVMRSYTKTTLDIGEVIRELKLWEIELEKEADHED